MLLGAYGVVYKALRKEDGEPVAIKMTRFECDIGMPPTTVREIALLRELHHPNIILCVLFINMPEMIMNFLIRFSRR